MSGKFISLLYVGEDLYLYLWDIVTTLSGRVKTLLSIKLNIIKRVELAHYSIFFDGFLLSQNGAFDTLL